ncbi:response regulator [Sphingomonas kaistensis]|uniref:Response regulator n=1 Tax=Sphingomonas kaistensis TaxID=298708 RepID=A0ABZ2G193_9SPHN
MTVQILYVDDDDDLREVALMALGLDLDLVVTGCASGEEAVRAAAGLDPHLILLDVMMPRMDGPATLAALRNLPHLAHVPVVFITARTQARDAEPLLALGALGIIAKPFDPMTLAQSVRDFLQR